MAGGGRSNYTEQEDELLVKYIAKYNPLPGGRLGNKLYMTLVENAGKKWNWARAHSWQSWRERYKKNQDEFDSKIRRYMRKRAAVALEKEFSSQTVETEAKPTKARGENDDTDRKLIDSSNNRAPNKDKGKQVAGYEHAVPEASSSRPFQNAEEAKKKRSATGRNDTRHIAPKSRKLSEDVDEAAADQHFRPPLEDMNGEPNAAQAGPSTSKTSKVEGRSVELISVPVEETESVDQPLGEELMNELFGSYVEEEKDDELVPDSQAESEELEPNSVVQSIYPKLPGALVVDEPHVPGAFEPIVHEPISPSTRPALTTGTIQPTPAAPLPKKLKPKLRKLAKEDPFETTSESSPPAPRPRYGLARTGGLPVLVDDGIRTTLKRPRRSSVGEENGPRWPPKRAKKNPEETRAHMDVDTVAPVDTKKTQINQPQLVPPSGRPVHVNAVASSSKTQLSPAPTIDHQSKPLASINASKVTAIETSRTAVTYEVPPTKTAPAETNVSATYATSAKLILPVSRTSLRYPLPVGALSDNDPFTAKVVSEKDKGKARADFVIKDNQPLRIDLHKQSLQRRLTNTSLPHSANNSDYTSQASSSTGTKRKRHSRSSEGNASLRKSLMGIGPADPKFEFVVAAVEDIMQTLAQMASAYGVGEQIARATYIRTKSLEKTQFILQQLRDAMAEKERAIYAAMPELAFISGNDADADDSDEEMPGGLVIRSRSKVKEVPREEHGKHSKSPTRSSGRPSLSIRPIPDEEDLALSEYEPPSKSHASKFARLMKQGRVDEAVEREKRRVSGLFIQDTQNLGQPSPPSAPVSPTPLRQSRDAPMEVDDDGAIADNPGNGAESPPEEDDADDIYVHDDEMDREADDESEHEEEAPGSSPSYPAIEGLIKRLSGGRSNEPVFLATAQRHRELALGADMQNEEELRQFEEEHNSSVLRLWSVKWAKEMLRDFPKIHSLEDQAAVA